MGTYEAIGREAVARAYALTPQTDYHEATCSKNARFSNYLLTQDYTSRKLSEFEKILKQEMPTMGYDGAKATQEGFSFSYKGIRNSIYRGRN